MYECFVHQFVVQVQAHLAEYARNSSTSRKGGAQSPLSLSLTSSAKYASVTGSSLESNTAEAGRYGWEEDEDDGGEMGGRGDEGGEGAVDESFGGSDRGGSIAIVGEEPRQKLLDRRGEGPAS